MKNEKDNFVINSIVFDENPIDVIEQYNLTNEFYDYLLSLLNSFINLYNDMQYFDDYIVENIYNIINYIKYNYKYINIVEKNNKYDEFNSMIQILNSCFKVNNDWFYLSQGLERGIYLDYGMKKSDYIISNSMRFDIRSSICYDKFFYDILSKSYNNISSSEFNVLVMNTLFIYSVNYFKYNYLDLCNNSIIRDVLLANNKIINSFGYVFNNTDYEKSKSLKFYSKSLLKELRWD